VQQGLFVLSTLPACSCPAIAMITDGVSSLLYAPPLALRWRDTALLIILPPPGHAAHPTASRFAIIGSRHLHHTTNSLSLPAAAPDLPTATIFSGGIPAGPRCAEAFGMIDDFEGLQEVATFANGLILQLPRSAADEMARRISAAQAGGPQAGVQAVGGGTDGVAGGVAGRTAGGGAGGWTGGSGGGAAGGGVGGRANGCDNTSSAEAAAAGFADQGMLLSDRSNGTGHAVITPAPDVAVARALLWRGASERACVTAHAAALLAGAPAEWRIRAGVFALMSTRAADQGATAGARGGVAPRHRERLHQYDVGSQARVSDLLALRVLEGFTVAFPPPADGTGTVTSPAGLAGWSQPAGGVPRRGEATHDGVGGVGGGETQLKVSLDWVQGVTIEYMVRRRVRQRTLTPSPSPHTGEAGELRTAVIAACPSACPPVSKNASGCFGIRGRNGGSVGGSEDGPTFGSGGCLAPASRSWEARLRVSITVLAPLAFWIQYERLRLSRRHGGQPELSGAP
jgi:hypothetical protein